MPVLNSGFPAAYRNYEIGFHSADIAHLSRISGNTNVDKIRFFFESVSSNMHSVYSNKERALYRIKKL